MESPLVHPRLSSCGGICHLSAEIFSGNGRNCHILRQSPEKYFKIPYDHHPLSHRRKSEQRKAEGTWSETGHSGSDPVDHSFRNLVHCHPYRAYKLCKMIFLHSCSIKSWKKEKCSVARRGGCRRARSGCANEPQGNRLADAHKEL